MKIKKAIIPAAGLGTRFLPATKAQPKEMLPIVDKPTIQYIVEEAIASGIEDIIIITGKNKRAIEDHFDYSLELEKELAEKEKEELLKIVKDISNLVDIHYIRQKQPKGLGDAVLHAKAFIHNEPFAVLLGDNIIQNEQPCLKQLMIAYEQIQSSIVGVSKVNEDELYKFGVIKPLENYDGSNKLIKLHSVVEKPKENPPSDLAIMGRYIFEPEIFSYLEKTTPGVGGEIQLTDAIQALIQNKSVYGYCYDGKTYDVGSKIEFLKATVEIALQRPDLKDEFAAYLKQLLL